ncbi:MAG: hypothetical protein ACOYL6_05250 [Bacteriovoracaceae bacterium]
MIEFLVAFIFSVGFLFLFISLGLNFTAGYMGHYATFMASRTYLTGGNDSISSATSDAIAKTRAIDVFNRNYAMKAFGVDVTLSAANFNEPPSGPKEKYEYVGVKIEFQKNLSMVGFGGGDQKLNLVSESFLGREPTRADCVEQLCQVMGVCGENTDNVHITLEDNGC